MEPVDKHHFITCRGLAGWDLISPGPSGAGICGLQSKASVFNRTCCYSIVQLVPDKVCVIVKEGRSPHTMNHISIT